jgi:hypothetical protein
MAYTIETSDGQTLGAYETYDDAVDAITNYVGCNGVVGHAGDLSEGGDKTLAWYSEEEAENDPGANAAAVIRAS